MAVFVNFGAFSNFIQYNLVRKHYLFFEKHVASTHCRRWRRKGHPKRLCQPKSYKASPFRIQ